MSFHIGIMCCGYCGKTVPVFGELVKSPHAALILGMLGKQPWHTECTAALPWAVEWNQMCTSREITFGMTEQTEWVGNWGPSERNMLNEELVTTWKLLLQGISGHCSMVQGVKVFICTILPGEIPTGYPEQEGQQVWGDHCVHGLLRAPESQGWRTPQFISVFMVPKQHQDIQKPLLHFLQMPSKIFSASELRFPQ